MNSIADHYLNSEFTCRKIDQLRLDIRGYKNPLEEPEDVLKFIKIRSRMMMCIEQTVFPESIGSIVTTLKRINDPGFESLLNQLKFAETTLRCKIGDVLGEFDLWEEINYTIQAKELYDFPAKGSEHMFNYEIKVAEVSKTFDEIKPLYTIPNTEEQIEYTDKLGNKRIVKRGLYSAVIQDKMPGLDVKDYLDDGYFDKITDNNREEYSCLKDAMSQFLGIYIKAVISPGKYHGDPHAGNIKWFWDKKTKRGILSPIDFGDWVTIPSKNIFLIISIALFLVLVSLLNDINSIAKLNPYLIVNLFLVGLDINNYSNEELIRIVSKK